MAESPFRADILKGKVALITGGGSGIGFEICSQFGKHGAFVAIMGRRKPILDAAVSQLQSLGISIHQRKTASSCIDQNLESWVGGIQQYMRKDHMGVGFEGDVRKQEDAKRVVESTVKHFGKLDILVNSAAGNFLVSAEDLSPNGFRTVMDIDSVGTFTMCHEALEFLKKGGQGRKSANGGTILNISATLHYTAAWYQIHVSAAKAAVDAITRNLALEWGADYDIKVNGIAPGPIGDTPGMSKLVPDEMNSSKPREYMPLYKLGDKWDIAMAAVYLASDAGKYVNGTTLVVDGGLWLSRPRHLQKEAVKQLSRAVEKRSRDAPVGLPTTTTKLPLIRGKL